MGSQAARVKPPSVLFTTKSGTTFMPTSISRRSLHSSEPNYATSNQLSESGDLLIHGGCGGHSYRATPCQLLSKLCDLRHNTSGPRSLIPAIATAHHCKTLHTPKLLRHGSRSSLGSSPFIVDYLRICFPPSTGWLQATGRLQSLNSTWRHTPTVLLSVYAIYSIFGRRLAFHSLWLRSGFKSRLPGETAGLRRGQARVLIVSLNCIF